jgi:hypothetical protein
MKALLDTDILLDVALQRGAFFERSAAVLSWAESTPGQAAVAWHSLSNISNLVRPDSRGFIRDLLRFVVVAPTSTDAAIKALNFPMSDFEDALQAAAALAFGSAFIVTRNLPHYRNSPVPAVPPSHFLTKLRRE